MVVKNVGLALRYCIPQMVGQKIGNFWVIDIQQKTFCSADTDSLFIVDCRS